MATKAGSVVVLIFVAAVGAALATTADAAAPKPGIALERTGTADCAKVLEPGSEITFAARVTGGHAICVTHQGEQFAYYFDGRKGGGADGPSFTAFFGGIGTVNGQLVVFGNIPPTASSMRLLFCKGQTIVLRPLNTDTPQYVGAMVDARKYGTAFPQAADENGKPLHPDEDAQRIACLGTPTTTTRRK
jgi:hypothetical protein